MRYLHDTYVTLEKGSKLLAPNMREYQVTEDTIIYILGNHIPVRRTLTSKFWSWIYRDTHENRTAEG